VNVETTRAFDFVFVGGVAEKRRAVGADTVKAMRQLGYTGTIVQITAPFLGLVEAVDDYTTVGADLQLKRPLSFEQLISLLYANMSGSSSALSSLRSDDGKAEKAERAQKRSGKGAVPDSPSKKAVLFSKDLHTSLSLAHPDQITSSRASQGNPRDSNRQSPAGNSNSSSDSRGAEEISADEKRLIRLMSSFSTDSANT
jgi:hypothetical protein